MLEAKRPDIRLLGALQGQLGLDMAREQRPDLILFDLQPPDLPGDELLRRLQADGQTRDIPVIMVMADATKEQSRRLLDLGARTYLTKPLDIQVFLRAIDEVLTANQARRPNGELTPFEIILIRVFLCPPTPRNIPTTPFRRG